MRKDSAGSITHVWLEFPLPRIGALLRDSNQTVYSSVIPRTWTAIEPMSREFYLQGVALHSMTRTQFPLQLLPPGQSIAPKV